MQGVQGLQSYIAKNAAARNRVDLAILKDKCEQGSKPLLLCDLCPVVEFLLSAYDAHLVKTGQLSPYALLYGGDLKLYGQRILAFVRALRHVGVSPIFFLECSPGANVKHFETVFSQLCSQHEQVLERCAAVHQVCDGTGDILKVHWQLGQDALSEIASCLQSEGVCLVFCTRGTTAEMIEYQRTHSTVVGVLSTNPDFALAVGSTYVPLSFFDLEDTLGIHSAMICPDPTSIVCEYVDSDTLCQTLELKDERNLVDIAILCGNQFTAQLNVTCEPCKQLGLASSSFECVSSWAAALDPEQWPHIAEDLHFDPVYREAITQSFDLYAPSYSDDSGGDGAPARLVEKTNANENYSLIKVEVKVCDTTLVSINNGVYWRWPVLEPVSLGQSCFHDLTLPLRKKVYSVLGQELVYEHGRTSAKTFTTVSVQVDDKHDMCVTGWSENQRLVALFQLMTDYGEGVSTGTFTEAVASTVSELDGDLTCVLPKVVPACASLCFMCHLASEPGYSLEHHELQALLITCLFCSASVPPHVVPERPSSRALTVAMQFSHTIEQAQLLASALRVKDSLPSPSSVFYPMAYIPHHMASILHPQEQQPSATLKEAYHNYHWIVHNPPVSQLIEELSNNWRQPNLKRLVKLFAESMQCIQNHNSFLFLSSQLPSLPPPNLQLNFNRVSVDEDYGEDDIEISTTYGTTPCKAEVSNEEVKEKLPVSPKSDHDWTELSSSQDRLVLEDFQYFSHGFVEEGEGLAGERLESVQSEDGKEVGWGGVKEKGVGVETEALGVGSNEGVIADDVEYDSLNESDSESQGSFSPSNKREKSASVDLSATEEDITPRPPSSSSSSSYSSCNFSQSVASPSPTTQWQFQRRRGPDLPIAAHRLKLLELIEQNRIVCVEGETGCGKSTRVPQYILDYSLCLSPPRECQVLVSQPRRMAAIKLAERVATERGERVGYTVGYCVGGEHTNSSTASITYCTTGYLLQALVHNPDMLNKYTHVILDEIHERSTDADFTLLVVRELMASHASAIKLVIMSATMQGSLVVNYLQQHFTAVAGPYFVGVKHFDVDTYFIDELRKIPRNLSFWNECQLKAATTLQHLADNRPVESLKSAMRARPCVSTYAQEVCTEVVISQAHKGESILIFLPGYHEIAHYFEYLQSEISGRGLTDHFRMFILHSQVPLEDQRDAFVDPPPNLAHVILATNIAESSITLPKLRIVINFGVYRRLQYDSKRHISCLVKSWCSRASCEQRAGRAGRVFVGTVVHLLTRKFHDVVLPAYDPPEILMAPIAKLVLQAKQIGRIIGHPRPSQFLSRAIEPPSLQQLEAALQDLARLGAIESHPGEEIDEEADITFLGHFSLSLPVDLDLSRVVLYGILFGCAADAVVMAAAMSLPQDVFSLPSRVLMKNEKEFQQSLSRSYKSRCSFDSQTYSDAIMVRNLFKEWLEFRAENLSDKSLSKYTLARRFSGQNACRWERLLQLESLVSEISQKTLHHVPTGTAVHCALHKLVSLRTIRTLNKQGSSRQQVTGPECFNVDFCDDEDVLRAMLAASYPHQLLYGVRQCDSLNEQERAAAQGTLKLMKSAEVDVSRTLVVSGGKKSSKAAVQHLLEIVLPDHFCNISSFGSTSLITLNYSFESNPLTSLLRNLNVIPPLSTDSTYPSPQAQTKMISSSLPPELILLWQFGERRPQWRVGDISVSFSRPEHPFSISWFRVTKENEGVQNLSWRNPTGFMCEVDPQRTPSPFLAVASHLQGFGTHSYVSANNITLLPPLQSGRNALLLALAFQPLTAKVGALVDPVYHQIAGIDINSFTLSPFPPQLYLDPVDISNVNQLRQVLSEVFTSNFTSNHLSTIFLSEVPVLLSKLLYRGKMPRPDFRTLQQGAEINVLRQKGWEELLTTEPMYVCESDESDESDSDEEGDESADSTGDHDLVSVSQGYQYLPPFRCSILKHLPVDPTSDEKTCCDAEESSVSVPDPIPASDPVSDPASDPVGDPADDPVGGDPASDPVGDPADDPVGDDPASDPVGDPASDPVGDPASDSVGDPASDPVGDPASNPVSDPADDPASNPVSDPADDPASDPVSDPADDPASDPVSVVDGSQSQSDTESDTKTKFKLSPNAPEFVPTGLQEEETSSSTTQSETCSDDHSSSVQPSNDQHTSVAVPMQPADVPLLPLPTPSSTDVPLSSVLKPQVLSYVAHLPLKQQQDIKEHIAGVWRALLPKNLADQSGNSQTGQQNPPNQSEQSGEVYSNKGLSLEAMEQGQEGRQISHTAGSQRAANASARHSTRLGQSVVPSHLIQPPVIPTTTVLPPHPPVAVLQQMCPVVTATSGFDKTTANIPSSSVPFTARKSPPGLDQHLLRSGVLGSPPFPHPYTAHSTLRPSYPHSSCGMRGMSTASIQLPTPPSSGYPPVYPAQAPVRPLPVLSGGILPHSSPCKLPMLNLDKPPAVSFPKLTRKTLLTPLQSLLDLRYRAPGARLSSKPVGGYQARYPAMTSLPPLSLDPPGMWDRKSTLSSRMTNKPISGASPRLLDSPTSTHRLAPSKSYQTSGKSVPLLETPSPYSVSKSAPASPSIPMHCESVWSSLPDYIEVYLRRHGNWAELRVVFEEYLRYKGLPSCTRCPHDLLNMCKGRFALRQSPTRGLIIERVSTVPSPEREVSSGMKEEGKGGPEKHLSQRDTITQPHCTDEVEEEKDVNEGVGVGERGGSEGVVAVTSGKVVDVNGDTADRCKDGQISINGNLCTPLNTSNESECASIEEAELNTEEAFCDVTHQPQEHTTDVGTAGAEQLMEEGTAGKDNVRKYGVEEEGRVSTEETFGPTETELFKPGLEMVSAGCTDGGDSQVEDTAHITSEVASEGNREISTAGEVHVEPESDAAPANAVEAAQQEDCESALDRADRDKYPVVIPCLSPPHTSDISGGSGQEGESLSTTGGRDVLTEVRNGSSSRAVSPPPTRDTACGTVATVQQSASDVWRESGSEAASPSVSGGTIPLSTSTVLLCRDEDVGWVEGGGSGRTSPTDSVSRDTHVTDESDHLPGSDMHRMEFFVACLQLVGGHSHLNKLSVIYRAAYKIDTYTRLDLFLCYPDLFQVKKKGASSCVRLIRNVDLSKSGVTPMSLAPATVELMMNCRDMCPISGQNMGGTAIWPVCKYHRSTSTEVGRECGRKDWERAVGRAKSSDRRERKKKKGKKSHEGTGDPGDRQWRENSYTPSGPVRERRSSRRLSHFDRKPRSPRFPKDVESHTDPGHVSHILKFYTEFFATRTEPISYSDLLSEYITASGLPSDFYLPSDILKNDFEVFREHGKRYIRPLDKAEFADTSSSETAPCSNRRPPKNEGEMASLKMSSEKRSKKSSSVEAQRSSPRDKVEVITFGCKSGGGQRAKSSGEPSSRASLSPKNRDGDSPNSSSERVGKLTLKSKDWSVPLHDPQEMESSTDEPAKPGDDAHVLQFFKDLFADRHEPLPLEGFSRRYLVTHSLPKSFIVDEVLIKKHFLFFRDASGVRRVCPHSWKWDPCSHTSAPVAPVVHDTPAAAEVWGEEEEEEEEECTVGGTFVPNEEGERLTGLEESRDRWGEREGEGESTDRWGEREREGDMGVEMTRNVNELELGESESEEGECGGESDVVQEARKGCGDQEHVEDEGQSQEGCTEDAQEEGFPTGRVALQESEPLPQRELEGDPPPQAELVEDLPHPEELVGGPRTQEAMEGDPQRLEGDPPAQREWMIDPSPPVETETETDPYSQGELESDLPPQGEQNGDLPPQGEQNSDLPPQGEQNGDLPPQGEQNGDLLLHKNVESDHPQDELQTGPPPQGKLENDPLPQGKLESVLPPEGKLENDPPPEEELESDLPPQESDPPPQDSDPPPQESDPPPMGACEDEFLSPTEAD